MSHINALHSAVLVAAAMVLAMPDSAFAAAPDVDVTITVDNGYGFGYGSATTMNNYFGGVCNVTAGQIYACSGPEDYVVSGASVDDFLYLIAWSDDQVRQGAIGQFKSGMNPPIYTGVGNWEVYATGVDYDVSSTGPCGPDLATINAQIAIANAASGSPSTTSVGWVGTTPDPMREGILLVGEDNHIGGTGPVGSCTNLFSGQICPSRLDEDAHWIWYQRPGSSCAFLGGNHREFLIFRLAISEVTGGETPAPASSGTSIAITIALLVVTFYFTLGRLK